ncbi:MAG TPA: hypothetical protein VG369_03285 [Humibacter sp.]|nr:hypothetical protein [Humibacter sp.]
MRARETDVDGATDFDVAAFTRSARGTLRDVLDVEAIRVSAPEAELLGTLCVLEGATMAHLRNVLVTATHKDARVTAFLVTWAFEKYWIADALSSVSGSRATPTGSLPGGPVRRATGGFIAGRSIVGAHMVAGYLDDLVLDAAYDAVESDAAPPLRELLAVIRGTKSRHTAFFLGEATKRLASDPRSVRLAERSVQREAWPIGAPLLDAATRAAFTRSVFGGKVGEDRAEAVADAIAALPGIRARTASELARTLAEGD